MPTRYYFIKDLNIIGKDEDYVPYIYQSDKGWVVDQNNILMDRIMGYVPGEVSMYGIGNTDMMERVEKISEEEAMKFIAKSNK